MYAPSTVAGEPTIEVAAEAEVEKRAAAVSKLADATRNVLKLRSLSD
jgi:hypothetical protein